RISAQCFFPALHPAAQVSAATCPLAGQVNDNALIRGSYNTRQTSLIRLLTTHDTGSLWHMFAPRLAGLCCHLGSTPGTRTYSSSSRNSSTSISSNCSHSGRRRLRFRLRLATPRPASSSYTSWRPLRRASSSSSSSLSSLDGRETTTTLPFFLSFSF